LGIFNVAVDLTDQLLIVYGKHNKAVH